MKMAVCTFAGAQIILEFKSRVTLTLEAAMTTSGHVCHHTHVLTPQVTRCVARSDWLTQRMDNRDVSNGTILRIFHELAVTSGCVETIQFDDTEASGVADEEVAFEQGDTRWM